MARAQILTSAVLSAAFAAGLSACSTVQENPNYQYSTKYQGTNSTSGANTSYAQNNSYATTTPATYQGTSYQGATYSGSTATRSAEQDCRRKESNREIIGGAAGGALGAFAGKKIIGGTAGTIAGAAIGGTAGYGLGDISVDCSQIAQPVYQQQSTYQQPTYQQPAATYQAAPVYQTQPTQSTVIEAQPAPISAPVAIPSPAPIAAPTDQQYAGQEITGTPGYQVFNPQGPQTTGESVNETTLTISGPVHSASSSSLNHTQNTTNGAVEIQGYDYSANLISADTAVAAGAFPFSQTRILGGPALQSYRVQPGDTVYGLSRKLCVGVADIQQPNNIDANYGIKIGQTISVPQNRC